MWESWERRKEKLDTKLKYLCVLQDPTQPKEEKIKAMVYMKELDKEATNTILMMLFNPISLWLYVAIIVIAKIALNNWL